MASGVKVSDEVKKIFEEMKVVKNDADEQKRVRIVVFGIDGAYIGVKEVFRQENLKEEDDILKFLQKKLPEDSCCYVLYDCHYETNETKKEELVYITWTANGSNIKEKMLYSSSKDALSRIFKGIKHNFEFHDNCDTDRCEIASKLGKDTVKIEGKCV